MARRRCAVLVDHDANLLPLHVRAHGTGGSRASLLDQYGCGGDLRPGGRHADRAHRSLARDVTEIVSFVMGFTLFYWAIATWWIPMLLDLGVWRYLICGVPLAYDPLYWGGVFPLGMYSVCTYNLANILETPLLLPLSQLFMIIAVLAWAVTFAGLVDSRLNRGSHAQ